MLQEPSHSLAAVQSFSKNVHQTVVSKTQFDDDEEENNDHLSYVNCSILLPSVIFAFLSVTFILLGLSLGHFYDIRRREAGQHTSWLIAAPYWYQNRCSVSI